MTEQFKPTPEHQSHPQQRYEKEPADLGVERIGPGDSRFAEAEKVEYTVFAERNFTKARPSDQRVIEYDEYHDSSIFNIRVRDDKIMSVLREIWHSERGFKTLNDFNDKLYPLYRAQIEQEDPERIVEIGTVAALKESRQNKQAQDAEHLYSNSFRHSYFDKGIKLWIASIDADLLKVYRRWYEFQFEDIGKTDPDYMGGPTTPVMMDLDQQAKYYHDHRPDDLYHRLIDGQFEAQP
jgi:hypothetical protein